MRMDRGRGREVWSRIAGRVPRLRRDSPVTHDQDPGYARKTLPTAASRDSAHHRLTESDFEWFREGPAQAAAAVPRCSRSHAWNINIAHKRRGRIAAAAEMVAPAASTIAGIEPALGRIAAGIEQIFGPWPQRALDPLADRNPEAGLGPLDQRARDAGREATRGRCACRGRRAPSCRAGCAPRARRRGGRGTAPGSRGDRHRCPVDLRQYVVGQVGYAVAIHHPDRIRSVRADVEVEVHLVAAPTQYRRRLVAPFVEKRAIDLVEAARGGGDAQRLLHLAAEMRLPAAGQDFADPAPELRRQFA